MLTLVCLCIYLLFNDTATTEIYTYCHTLSLHDALPVPRPPFARGFFFRTHPTSDDGPPSAVQAPAASSDIDRWCARRTRRKARRQTRWHGGRGHPLPVPVLLRDTGSAGRSIGRRMPGGREAPGWIGHRSPRAGRAAWR